MVETIGFQSVVAHKFLDSFSIFDWGRMPDGIPNRGKFQACLQAFIHQKIASKTEWEKFLRSTDALAFRKSATTVLQNGKVTASMNELADFFPMRTSDRGVLTESNYRAGKMETVKLSPEMIGKGESFYHLSESFPEEKVVPVTVLGKTVWNFSGWKQKAGPKALPFEMECEFLEDFPRITLRCFQKTLSTEVSLTEALLITEFAPEQLQELILRAAWIAGFTQFHLKSVSPIEEKKLIRIKMGVDEAGFVFLGASVEFSEIEARLEKYYSSTLWGKVVFDLQQQARLKGIADWKKHCAEPTPWLDPGLKKDFAVQYQQKISGIVSCLSE